MSNSKYKRLFSNTALFAIANMGTKLIQFILVPLYTYTMSKAQYGTVDIALTTINMLMPLFALSISDAVFRYTMDKNEIGSVLINGLIVTALGSVFVFFCIPIFGLFKIAYPVLFAGSLVLSLFMSLLQNYSRAAGFEKEFAFSGVINALILSALNILFLVHFKMAVQGYMLSMVIAYLLTDLYLFVSIKLWKQLDFKLVSWKKTKEYMAYSIPLIPNAFSWWFTNDANRYFILIFVGAAGNGLYAVANKIPSILTMIYNIFAQAWQMSAVEEFKSEKNSEFYSNVLNGSIRVLLIVACFLLAVIKPFMKVFVSPSYYSAWKFVSFLLLAATFSNASAFLGTIFLAAKKTRSIMSTTVIGMFVNLLFNLLLIPKFGVNGAGIGSSLGFLLVCITRYIMVNKRFVKISLEKDLLILLTGFFTIMIVNFAINSMFITALINCTITAILMLLQVRYILKLRDKRLG